ncbi:MAG: uroporphyrinogen-III synthase [Symploca sp. SIO2E9]|nr:uroporphyrinogen-III synthase [Symploca sp. SIO2E9]
MRPDKLTYGNDSSAKTPTLKGKTILVTRSAGQSSKFTQLLQGEGARVIEMPALVIGPPSNWEGLDSAITCLSDFDWLILTSTNGVDYFFERLWKQGKDASALAAIKIAVVGRKTAASLNKRNLQPDFIPPNFVADSLIQEFPETLAGKKVLFPRVETGGREVLVKEMRTQGAIVTEVAAYESRCPEQMASAAEKALEKQEVDVITFASSKTVKNFVQLLDISLQWQKPLFQLEGVQIASIGPQTSITCRQLLGRVDIEAEEYTLEGLTQAIIGSRE